MSETRRDRLAEALGGFWDTADQTDAVNALLPLVNTMCIEAAVDVLANVAASLDNPEDATETALSGVAWPISVLESCADALRNNLPVGRTQGATS